MIYYLSFLQNFLVISFACTFREEFFIILKPQYIVKARKSHSYYAQKRSQMSCLVKKNAMLYGKYSCAHPSALDLKHQNLIYPIPKFTYSCIDSRLIGFSTKKILFFYWKILFKIFNLPSNSPTNNSCQLESFISTLNNHGSVNQLNVNLACHKII